MTKEQHEKATKGRKIETYSNQEIINEVNYNFVTALELLNIKTITGSVLYQISKKFSEHLIKNFNHFSFLDIAFYFDELSSQKLTNEIKWIKYAFLVETFSKYASIRSSFEKQVETPMIKVLTDLFKLIRDTANENIEIDAAISNRCKLSVFTKIPQFNKESIYSETQKKQIAKFYATEICKLI